MNRLKNVLMDILLIVSCATLHAGNGSAGWGAFGGALGGSILGNAISQPRSTRTEVVQVPVQQAPAPRESHDDSVTIRKLKKENKELMQEVDELSDEVIALKKELKKLKAEKSGKTSRAAAAA
jgi:predicted RNase H-like nuclease (RuvC/YqgF family)